MDRVTVIRLVFFSSFLLILVALETIWPKRKKKLSRLVRWPSNLGLIFINNFVAGLFPVILPASLAILAREKGWGLLPLLDVPDWLNIVFTIIYLDLVIYWQHRFFHQVPLLWKIHRMHHTDQDLDVTTALRFHPFEIWISLVLKSVLVFILGIAPAGIIAFEIILNGAAMFNHANWRLHPQVDRIIRLVIVTPDMHRVHHSVIGKETDSNYGFNLSCWDRLFGSYNAQPIEGHQKMKIGLNQFHLKKHQNIIWMFASPFLKKDPPAE